MNKQTLEGQWKQLKGKAKEVWGDVSDDELEKTKGNYDQLVGCIQEQYGYSLEKAQKEVGDFFKSVSERIKS